MDIDIGTLLIWGAVLFVAVIALCWAVQALRVAYYLWQWALEWQFVGAALYVLLWVVAFPVMIAICFVGALVLDYSERKEEERRHETGWQRLKREGKG